VAHVRTRKRKSRPHWLTFKCYVVEAAGTRSYEYGPTFLFTRAPVSTRRNKAIILKGVQQSTRDICIDTQCMCESCNCDIATNTL